MARTWTQQEIWQRLSPTQRAAAMAIMEADGRDPVAARNVLGAIINRAERTGEPLGEHVSKPIYQPTIEPTQLARLPSILKSQQFSEMTALAEKRAKGEVGDWVQGATHFLAPEKTMVSLYQREPDKYHNWGPYPNSRGVPGKNWTGFDPQKGEYRGVIMRDASHAFLAPEGRHEARGGAPAPDFAAPADPFAGKPVQVADASVLPGSGDASHPTAAFQRPGEVLTAPSTGGPIAVASATPVGASPTADPNATLAGLGAYWKNQEEDKEKQENELAKAGSEAAAAMNSAKAPGASPMIQGPRLPRVDLGGILALLKAGGINPTMPGDLGTGGGTRRA